MNSLGVYPVPISQINRKASHRLGNILARFAHLLLLSARRDGVSRLIFLARDGYFLKSVTECLLTYMKNTPKLEIDYLPISRRATSLLPVTTLGMDDYWDMLGMHGGGHPLERLLHHYGVAELVPTNVNHLNSEEVKAFLSQTKIIVAIKRAKQAQIEQVRTLLKQFQLWGNPEASLVDVGWRGSIQYALQAAYHDEPGWTLLRGYYLGLWKPRVSRNMAEGILGDPVRGRSLMESSPWQAWMIMESICRASHGTVLYYRQAGELVEPVYAGMESSLAHEMETETLKQMLWKFILDDIRLYAKQTNFENPLPEQLRREAQHDLLVLSFWPTQDEIQALGRFYHTEGSCLQWQTALVERPLVHPLRNPLIWLKGFKSCWKGGYFMGTGGYLLSTLYCGSEWVFIWAPWLKTWLFQMVNGLLNPFSKKNTTS